MEDWIDLEFSTLKFGDPRVDRHGRKIIRTLSKKPQATISQAFNTGSECKCCYEFFANGKVTWQKILQPHQEATLTRIKEQPIVLLPVDTSSLNYTSKPSINDIGAIANKNTGIFIHPMLAITPERLHLGIVDARIWARKDSKSDLTTHELYALPKEEKEIFRWIKSYEIACKVAQECPETQVIMMTDREGDFAELFEEIDRMKASGRSADLIVRSAHNRTIKGLQDQEKTLLRNYLKSSTSIGEVTFTIPSATGRPERTVTQVLKAGAVTFKKRYTSCAIESPEITLNAVMAIEEHPPKDQEPLMWIFLTTLPVATFEEVKLVVSYYLARWEIETFFKILKSGCLIEKRYLQECESLMSLLAIFLVISWRILHIQSMSREFPKISCEAIFSQSEWQATYQVIHKKAGIPTEVPTLGEFTIMVARLGGYLNRKNDPPPGATVLWRGLEKVQTYTEAWDTFKSQEKIR